MRDLMLASGITFHFERAVLEVELKRQIDKNTKEANTIEEELPSIKAKVRDLESHGRARTPEHEEAEQRVAYLGHVLENLRNKNEFLSFYAAHLPPGPIVLTMSDARELGFVNNGDRLMGMVATRKRGY